MIGYLGHSLSDFLSLEPREVIKILDVARGKLQAQHRLQYIATVNAIGVCFGGKDFDYIDAFASSNSSNNETYTDDEVEFLKNNF